MKPEQGTLSGLLRPVQTMQTSLQGIANRAKESKNYRFTSLYRMLNESNLHDSWRYMNRNASSGVDRVSARDYETNLEANITALVDRLKNQRYKAKLIRRVEIPKGDGKIRPLGIPTVEDKLLQHATARILSAIYEADFIENSFGYRPGRGAHDAVSFLTRSLQFGNYGYVVEADIRSYFDTIDHAKLVTILEERVNDSMLIRLIKKWLNAGVLLTDGKVIHSATGTPQGGVISPVLANIYLHKALDQWFTQEVLPRMTGKAILCRYADDFVCLFENRNDAEKFYKVLGLRLAKFGLDLAPDKTRIFEFKNYQPGQRRFSFLGFEFSWIKNRIGKYVVQRRTARKKLYASIREAHHWVKEHRHLKLNLLVPKLNRKLRGYYNYYGVIGNYRSLSHFYYCVCRSLFKWLNRRSQKKSMTWSAFLTTIGRLSLLSPKITEKRTVQRLLFQA